MEGGDRPAATTASAGTPSGAAAPARDTGCGGGRGAHPVLHGPPMPPPAAAAERAAAALLRQPPAWIGRSVLSSGVVSVVHLPRGAVRHRYSAVLAGLLADDAWVFSLPILRRAGGTVPLAPCPTRLATLLRWRPPLTPLAYPAATRGWRTGAGWLSMTSFAGSRRNALGCGAAAGVCRASFAAPGMTLR